jgi:putative ABC transport system permease protein
MIRNYLVVAIRNILRNKLTSFINVAGLALAMGCAVLIYFYVTDEISYDRYNSKEGRTYRITRDFISKDGSTNLRLANVAPPIGPLIKNDFGEVEVMARTLPSSTVVGLEQNGELKKSITEENIYVAEPDIFRIFDFQIESGDAKVALNRPFTVMLSEGMAIKYFGTLLNVVGRRLRFDNQYDLEVTGVYKKLPPQAHWHPEFLISFSTLNDSTIYGRKGLETNWGNNAFGTYVLLHEGVNPEKLQVQFPGFIDRHYGTYVRKMAGAPTDFVGSKVTRLNIQKVTDIHLHSHLDDELEANGNINNVYMITVIGIFIVLIACFNFVNLSTARASMRAKEVGLRKVVGAFRNQLIWQYLSESIMMALIALILAIVLSGFSMEWLNHFTGKRLSFDIIHHWPVVSGLIGFAIVVGLLAGIYPAFIISGFKPALVLKSEQGTTGGKGRMRKTLVVMQFAISVGLIIATAITSQQLKFLNTEKLGYDKDQIVTLPYYADLNQDYSSFYHELTKNSLVRNASRSSRVPTGRLLDSYGSASILNGDSLKPVDIELKSISTDEEFFDSYGIKIAAGRSFSKSIPTDDSLAFIVNEAAARKLEWRDLGKEINREFQYAGVRGKLVGIVSDFHFESLHQSIVPMIFLVRKNNFNTISIKLSGNNMQEGIAYVEKVWKEFLPKRPFDYQFLNEKYRRLYDAEQRQSQLFTIFSGLAIFIACLGLFGLATFNTLLRIREIGIRKVLGASIASILTLLSREIVALILIANLIAWPAAWYWMRQWLNTFAYHINMNMLVFLGSAAVAIVLALITVSAQTVKAAMSNPSQTLRRE